MVICLSQMQTASKNKSYVYFLILHLPASIGSTLTISLDLDGRATSYHFQPEKNGMGCSSSISHPDGLVSRFLSPVTESESTLGHVDSMVSRDECGVHASWPYLKPIIFFMGGALTVMALSGKCGLAMACAIAWQVEKNCNEK